MPIFIIETTAESPIREFWQVEAESAQQARDKFEAGQVGAFLWDEVMGDETEREVAQVHPRADLAGTISLHNAQQEAPAMLAALRDAMEELQAWRSKYHPIQWPDKPVVHTATRDKIRAILSRIDGAPTAQPAGDDPAVTAAANLSRTALVEAAGEALALQAPISEAGDRCASCGAEEGESHGAQCEARGFAMGADARRLDTGALRSVTGDDADWLEATASRDGGEC